MQKSHLEQIERDETEILYLYGLDFDHTYPSLKSWLKNRPERRLIILEDDLTVFGELLKREKAQEMLGDPQVTLHHLQNWESDLEMLAQTFPSDRVAFTALPSYEKRNKKQLEIARLKLLRNTAALHALLVDGLYSHKLFANLVPNLLRLPEAFYANALRAKFSNVPALICGAGPSLKAAVPTLKKLENRALIFAGGSTLAALSNFGIRPHFAAALDPNPEEYHRLKPSSAFEVPFLYANRLLASVFSTVSGPFGYIKSDTGGSFENWIEEKLGLSGPAIGPDLGREAFSVTTLSIAYAHALGCNPIILTGVDLAYTGMKRYAEGVLSDARVELKQLKTDKRLMEQILYRKDRKGKKVCTLLKWVMESECISQFAEAHPECRIFNATEEGIGFQGIPFRPLEEILKKDLKETFDLRGWVHAEIAQSKISDLFPDISREKILHLYQEIEASLKRSRTICRKMLTSPSLGQKVLLEFEWEEEIAYPALLQLIELSLERTLHRHILDPDAREKRKWSELSSIIDSLLTTLKTYTR